MGARGWDKGGGGRWVGEERRWEKRVGEERGGYSRIGY